MPITQIGPDEQLLILNMIEDGKTIQQIALEIGRSETPIRRIVNKFHPTTVLATKFLRAKALKLAERVVKHSTVEEAIDVLSRPNIDVLKPLAKEQTNIGFFTSVSLDSCGAVKEVKGVVIDAVTGSQISDDQEPHAIGLQQEQQGNRGQEHEDGRDTHGRGVRGGQGERGAPGRRDTRGDPARLTSGEGAEAGAEEPSIVVDQPTGYTGDTRARGKKGPGGNKRNKIRTNPSKQIVESAPTRKAITKLARGHKTHDVDSSIHLRYDI